MTKSWITVFTHTKASSARGDEAAAGRQQPKKKDDPTNVINMRHPDYQNRRLDWIKFRDVFEGGEDFVDKYLEKFSKREDNTDFTRRRDISYSPAFAKAAIMEIKNSIYQRMVDISRKSGPQNYQDAVNGKGSGIDLTGNTMNGFIGRIILPELITMARVGIFIDKKPLPDNASRTETAEARPYIYHYRTEDIRSWTFDIQNRLTNLLLRDWIDVVDDDTGLTIAKITKYRLLKKVMTVDKVTGAVQQGVMVGFYDNQGILEKQAFLNLSEIPFVFLEISQSLLTDVADYQIALLNLASSDLNYSLKSNFPFYTEQFSPNSEMAYVRQATSPGTIETDGVIDDSANQPQGKAVQAARAQRNEVQTGSAAGRRYPQGLERPAFIHPSSEPLIASMQLSDRLKDEIRQLINLSLASVKSLNRAADSKLLDLRGLEAGLAYIGLELEYGERQLARIWSAYEGSTDIATVQYPTQWSLRKDEDRRKEAKELRELLPTIPSLDYQKAIAKEIVTITIGHKISIDDLDNMKKQIDESEVVVTDPEIIRLDHEAGFVGTELASGLRGYPEGSAEQAKKDHADRAARIALAQSEAGQRGVSDLDDKPKDNPKPTNTDLDNIPVDKTRGGGK